MARNYIFTSESVTEGHPDKMADQISDAVLDAMLAQDPRSRVACETMLTTGLVILSGEITSSAIVDFQDVVRKKVNEIGYDHSAKGFDGHTCGVMVAVHKQSPDISIGVTEGEGLFKDQGAGDQGLMFGYATDETENFMPLTIDLSHKLALKLSQVRKSGVLPLLRPDGKTQVSVEYEGDRIKRLEAIVVSSQHAEEMSLKDVQEGIMEEVIRKTIPTHYIDAKTKIFINPTGRFVTGGPMGDTGVTGRKIIVDTYGGHGGHGGGAFSGKDPSKVDRSAAYAARQVAKHVVAAKLARRAMVQVAYAIGVAEPVSLNIETFGSESVPVEQIIAAVNKTFDMRPKAIIQRLNLLRPIYAQTAAYGHFGRNPDNSFSWEELTYLDQLRSQF
ncbi:MAG: methionine adenosyltransferase [Oligoflexia bacterium]|nr:methionine adenosyltransferase [Oligoflexia bacterium]MBF0367025.1 methionine adenosyltransferase [Oligoflexia bacterium]